MKKIDRLRRMAEAILAAVDALPAGDEAEVRRVCNIGVPLAEGVSRGHIAALTEDGEAELADLAEMLASADFAECREMAADLQPGDRLEAAEFGSDERFIVRIDAINGHGRQACFRGTWETGPSAGQSTFVDVFWAWRRKPVRI